LPLRLVSQARSSYERIDDYACLFVKRERLHNQLQPENLVAMRVRTRPFSVDLQWLKPADMSGQEACFVAGRNAGQMRVRSAGLLGTVGFVSLDTKDRAFWRTAAIAYRSGDRNVISRFGEGWTMERSVNKTRVQVAEYDYNKRHCVRVETVHPDNSDRVFLFYRSVVYFDRENNLPIRVEKLRLAEETRRSGRRPGGVLQLCRFEDQHPVEG